MALLAPPPFCLLSPFIVEYKLFRGMTLVYTPTAAGSWSLTRVFAYQHYQTVKSNDYEQPTVLRASSQHLVRKLHATYNTPKAQPGISFLQVIFTELIRGSNTWNSISYAVYFVSEHTCIILHSAWQVKSKCFQISGILMRSNDRTVLIAFVLLIRRKKSWNKFLPVSAWVNTQYSNTVPQETSVTDNSVFLLS